MAQTRLFEDDDESASEKQYELKETGGKTASGAPSRDRLLKMLESEGKAGAEKDLSGFLQRSLEVGRRVLEMDEPLVVHHYDADGLSCGAIVCRALVSSGKNFSRRVAKRLDEKTIDEIAAQKKPAVFADLGSGYYALLSKKLSDFVVIDHHQPDSFEGRGENEANCELFGFSGSLDLSAAGTAYFCFRDRDEDGALAQLGIVGAVGDMMDLAGGGLAGLNRVLLEDALSKRSAIVQTDLRVFGRVSRPLVNFLSYCTEPFLPGLTGDEKACAAFLQKNGFPIWVEEPAGGGEGAEEFASDIQSIESGENVPAKKKWVRYYDLDVDERRRFASCLVDYALEEGVDESAVKAMVGEVYLFPREEENSELYDAYEYSTLLNACGRHGREEQGIAVCLGKESAMKEARKALQLHRTLIREGIFAARKNASDFGAFYFLDGRATQPPISDTVVGTIAGEYLASGLVERSKPIIAFATDENGNTKASGRGTKELVEKGLDLDEVMRSATEGIGYGGGHKIAAGASLSDSSPKAEKQFLLRCREALEKQFARS